MTDLKAAADRICHSDQLIIWANELLTEIEEHLNVDLYYDDVVDLHSAVQVEIKRIVARAFSHPELSVREPSDEITALQAENELLKLDAARYRWLRSRDLSTIDQGGVFAGLTPDNVIINGGDLDAEIDAALAGEREEG